MIKDYYGNVIKINQKKTNIELSKLGFSEGDSISVEIVSSTMMDWLQFLFIDDNGNVLEPAKTLFNVKNAKFNIDILSNTKHISLNVATSENYDYQIKIVKLSLSDRIIYQRLSIFDETIVEKTVTYPLDSKFLIPNDNIYVRIKAISNQLEWIQFLFLSKDGTIIEPAKTIFNVTLKEFYYTIPNNAAYLKLNVAKADTYKYELNINIISNVENDLIREIELLKKRKKKAIK